LDYILTKNKNKESDKLLNEITALKYLEILLNADTVNDIEDLKSNINKINRDIDTEEDLKKILLLQKKLESLINDIKLLLDKKQIDFFIFKQPKLISEEIKQIKTKKTKKKLDKKEETEQIPQSKDFPFYKLPVKILSTEECNSRSSKKPFFISLKDLISAIDKDDELKGIFGPAYKKMSKKELCDIMFKKN